MHVFWDSPQWYINGEPREEVCVLNEEQNLSEIVTKLRRFQFPRPSQSSDGSADDLVMFGGIAFDPELPAAHPWTQFGRACFVPVPIERRVTPKPKQELSYLDRQIGNEAVGSFERAAWRRYLQDLLAAIKEGKIEKAVAAREEELALRPAPDWRALPERLVAAPREQFEIAFRITMQSPGGPSTTFAGRTPETLVTVRDGKAMVDCLAGSAPLTPEDAQAGWLPLRVQSELMSEKNLREHIAVLDALVDALTPFMAEVDVPKAPAARTLGYIAHLYTPIEITLKPDVHVLDIVEVLHPTPAVCGSPRDEALALIREHESGNRGWYAGPVGWFDEHGNGEFAVALRSFLVHGEQVWLYAGAGIVEGSDADTEWEETEAKLRFAKRILGMNDG